MNELGTAVFAEVPPGEYTVRVEKMGFQTTTSSFTMPEDDYTVNITLAPAQQPPVPQPPPEQPPSQPPTQPPPEQPPSPPPTQPPVPTPVPQPPIQQPAPQPTPTAPSPLLKIAAVAAIAVLGLLILSSLGEDEDEKRKRY